MQGYSTWKVFTMSPKCYNYDFIFYPSMYQKRHIFYKSMSVYCKLKLSQNLVQNSCFFHYFSFENLWWNTLIRRTAQHKLSLCISHLPISKNYYVSKKIIQNVSSFILIDNWFYKNYSSINYKIITIRTKLESAYVFNYLILKYIPKLSVSVNVNAKIFIILY